MNSRIIRKIGILIVMAAILAFWPSADVHAFSCSSAQIQACDELFAACLNECEQLGCQGGTSTCVAKANACLARCGGT